MLNKVIPVITVNNNSIKQDDKVFLSNNQKYKKKEDVEYGKKSHLEYVKIMSQNKDPLGINAKGGLRSITMAEIKLHKEKNNLWTVLNGSVYDLTMYLDYHPGGEKKLMMGAGKDCTSLFSKKI
jgi:cytochrome-b5 reductase